jgi:hypothetical protein
MISLVGTPEENQLKQSILTGFSLFSKLVTPTGIDMTAYTLFDSIGVHQCYRYFLTSLCNILTIDQICKNAEQITAPLRRPGPPSGAIQ